MPRVSGQVTERSFYPVLIDLINESGGSGVSEVCFNSQPDIVFSLLGREWILSVKLGEDVPTLKSAFIQYQRHRDESGRDHGLILFLPDSLRSTPVRADALRGAVMSASATCLVDTPIIKEELSRRSFPSILRELVQEVGPRLKARAAQGYPLSLVIQLLQQHVDDLMKTVSLDDPTMLRVITDRGLLSGVGHLAAGQTEDVARFLAAYILLSQILFLRLFVSAQPNRIMVDQRHITHQTLRSAFSQILHINYRPIYEITVLDSVSPEYLEDTFRLIWGLEVERVRYELPGRIFHELMPAGIRKMLAAFYTRPQAADILTRLTVARSDATVFDPACGSGTILTAAYRQKLQLHASERIAGNPHKRFCENEIFGADIMPFAVHLTAANLAAMDPATTIGRTQIIQGDSLNLYVGSGYRQGVQASMLPSAREAATTEGMRYQVDLNQVDVVLMNPPFTKVERGIRRYISMSRFEPEVRGEVGLWGHFVPLADEFLAENGICGAVLPINILRGRESAKVREIIFSKWTPLYILKPTFNYGFSEWSEYRDVLVIARKARAPQDHRVKFCLVKKNLNAIDGDDAEHIADRVEAMSSVRSADLDIESFSIRELRDRFANLMWFCGGTDLSHRDRLVSFIDRFSTNLQRFPARYFREGFRPVPKGVSSFLFATRELEPSRTEEAFLSFSDDQGEFIRCRSRLSVEYELEKSCFTPTLRTGVGIRTMQIDGNWDYVAEQPYRLLGRVARATGFKKPTGLRWGDFWQHARGELAAVRTNLVVVHRINPYSPSTYLTAFVSSSEISPSNMMTVVRERDLNRAKAVAALMNSGLFFSQFFLLKEETTGRYINLRFYDLDQMNLYPVPEHVAALVRVFDTYGDREFPSLREQFDQEFDVRYREFWEMRRTGQRTLLSVLSQPVRPATIRLEFDLAVCNALGVAMDAESLTAVYDVIVKEMIVTRGLTRD